MSKTCLNKLPGNIRVDCTLPIHGIKDIYLIYVEDVTMTLSGDTSSVVGINFRDGTRTYRVEGYKQNIQVTTSMINTDASARLDVSVQFKASLSALTTRRISTGKFYVLVVTNTVGNSVLWGLQSPLQCTNIDYDSNANGGLATYSLSAPEGSVGNYPLLASQPVSDSIISKSV